VSELDDWRTEAGRHLDWQAGRARAYLGYYHGESQVIALMEQEERQAFRRLLDESHANWAELVIKAVAERLTVAGFRFGASTDQAWLIWQASRMDADHKLVQNDALVTGHGFALVQPDEANPTGVSITAESPLEATVLYAPGSRRRRVAAYKRFMDDPGDPGGQTTEVLILPDVIATWRGAGGEPELAPNPAGLVGMIEIRPQPETMGPPRSELDGVMSTLDRIHTTIFNRMVATDYAAFRQAWATGVKLARRTITDAEGGEHQELVRPYDVGANRLLINENPDGRFGSFPESTLRGYLDAVEQDVHTMAAISQTPPHYLLATMVNLAADAIKAAEAGLVSKCAQRALFIGEDWEEVARVALTLVGDPGAADVEGEVVWRDWETRSQGQLVDALVKLATIGVPREVLWERAGASPQEIDRWRDMAAREAAAAPPAPAPAPAPPAPAPA